MKEREKNITENGNHFFFQNKKFFIIYNENRIPSITIYIIDCG